VSIVVVGKHENMFPTIGFCAKQILGIIGSQIEIKIIFLDEIFINEEMLVTIKKFEQIELCQQKLTQ
jgi:hypothetical protein